MAHFGREPVTVYISGALHSARDIATSRRKYETLAQALTEKGFSPYLPHRQTDPFISQDLSPEEVFSHDTAQLKRSALVIAFLDEPSLGVGAEIAIALQWGIRVIGILPKGLRTSRFILGLLESNEAASLLEYVDISEAARFAWIKVMHADSPDSG